MASDASGPKARIGKTYGPGPARLGTRRTCLFTSQEAIACLF